MRWRARGGVEDAASVMLPSLAAPGSSRIGHILAWLLPAIVYATLLVAQPPARLGFVAGHRFTWAHAAALALLCLALRRQAVLSQALAFSLLLGLVALPLSAFWTSGRSDGAVIGGLLPFSDANDYYGCARRLAEGHAFSDSPFCSRRPLFVTFLAGLLAATGQNLRLTLALLVLLTGASMFAAALELRRTHGALASSVFLAVLYAFYRWYVSATLSEHLGIALGSLGFALAWRGAHAGGPSTFAFAALTLSLAQNARPGAMLTLAALVAWSGWRFREGRLVSWTAVALTGAAAALPFVASALLCFNLGRPEGLFANFSYVLYGLASGGDWTSATKDHPQLLLLAEPERVRRIYELAGAAFDANPLRTLETAVRAWGEFLFTPYSFSFVNHSWLNASLRLLSVIGLARCWRQREAPTASLLLALALGLVASVPFAPPWDVGLMRAYAATMGISAALPALAFAAGASGRTASASPDAAPARALYVFAGTLGILPLLAPVAMRVLVRPTLVTVPPILPCPTVAAFRVTPGSSVHVVADMATPDKTAYQIREVEFRRELADLHALYPGLASELARAEAPFTLLNVLDLRSLAPLYIVAPTRALDSSRATSDVVLACVEPARDAQARSYSVFWAETLRPIGRTMP